MGPFGKPRKPTTEDWVKIQGGKPEVVMNGGIFQVKHKYEGGEGIVVPTQPKQLKETVIIDLEGKPVEFPVALLRRFHGLPCETRSKKMGGKGYERE